MRPSGRSSHLSRKPPVSATLPLRPVHVDIRPRQGFAGARRSFWSEGGDPDARRHRGGGVEAKALRAHDLLDHVGELMRLLLVGLGQYERELVTADARDDVLS